MSLILDYARMIVRKADQKVKSNLIEEKVCGTPWVIYREDGKTERIIFKSDRGLIYSLDGDIIPGNWEYIAEANLLEVKWGNKHLLLRHGFLGEAIYVLKKDAQDSDSVLCLYDSEKISSSRLTSYLQSLVEGKLSNDRGRVLTDIPTVEIKLTSGEVVEIEDIDFNRAEPKYFYGKRILSKMPLKNGLHSYKVGGHTAQFRSLNNVIDSFYWLGYVMDRFGQLCTVKMKSSWRSFSIFDDVVFEDGSPAPSGSYKGSDSISRATLKVKDGIVTKVSRPLIRFL